MVALEMHKIPGSFHRSSLASHIMLVDGNQQQRGIFSELLTSKLRYRLTEMSGSRDAVGYFNLKGQEVDLILFDLSTVDRGFEAFAELRSAVPEIPIIALVQYGDYQSAAEALLLGAQDFLTKPVPEARMNVTLRNCIQLRNAKRETNKILMAQNNGGITTTGSQGTDTIISLLTPNGDTKKIEEIELAAIRFAIRFYNGRMTEVARKLGIGRSTLYRKLEAIGEF